MIPAVVFYRIACCVAILSSFGSLLSKAIVSFCAKHAAMSWLNTKPLARYCEEGNMPNQWKGVQREILKKIGRFCNMPDLYPF